MEYLSSPEHEPLLDKPVAKCPSTQADAGMGGTSQDNLDGHRKGAKLEVKLKVRGPPVRVQVGTGTAQTDFYIHKPLICASSGFFRRALAGPWIEAQENMVKLHEECPNAFSMYVNFLYEKEVIPSGCPNLKDYTKRGWNTLAKAWILGDRLDDSNFKDAVVDVIIARTKCKTEDANWFPIKATTKLIYDYTFPGAALRRLIVDQHIWHGGPDWIDSAEKPELDDEFLRDLILGFYEQMHNPKHPLAKFAPDRQQSTCSYHEHKPDEKCYKKA